jgi:23S rRNA pseudouridine2457 synthase
MSQHRTLIFCKPYRVLTSFTDPEGRPTTGDYVDVPNVYAAGRLDYDSEGLLLLTSHGKLAHRITHPGTS